MRYNNTFKVGDTPKVFIPGSINKDTVSVWSYDVSSLPTVITSFSIETLNDFNVITLNDILPDSFYIIKYDGGFEVIRVGTPPTVFFMYSEAIEASQIPYAQFDYNCEIIKTGYMEMILPDVYAVLITNLVKSFIQVAGTLTTITLPSKYVNTVTSINGSITLQRGEWQLIAIPENGKVKSTFLDRLAKQEGVNIEDLIYFVSAYPGGVNKFLTYVPGVTLESSEHNFNLVQVDGESKEVNGFWVKCKPWTHKDSDITYYWSSTEDGGE